MYLFHSSVFITQYAKDKPDYKLQGLMCVQLCIQLISCGLYSTVLYTSLWTFINTEFSCFEVQVLVWEKKLNCIHCHTVKHIYAMCAIYNFMKIQRAIMTMKYTKFSLINLKFTLSWNFRACSEGFMVSVFNFQEASVSNLKFGEVPSLQEEFLLIWGWGGGGGGGGGGGTWVGVRGGGVSRW